MTTSLLQFWGLKVPANKQVSLLVDDAPDRLEMIHVSKVALGPKADKSTKPHCVTIHDNEHGDIVLCTLSHKASKYQSSVEFVVTSRVVVSHTGDSDVYLSGFRSTELIEVDDEDEDEDEQLAEMGAPSLPNGNVKVQVSAKLTCCLIRNET
jgi:hypothetical protein